MAIDNPSYAVMGMYFTKVSPNNSSYDRGGGSNFGLVGQNVPCRGQCVEARSADLNTARSAKIFFRVIFQLPGWALVAPSCFALHCHCSLVSVQSVTVSLST